ncbi:ATP-binding protein, partial [Bacteroidia bacterium]|nr:ATP-binding protein [Bacteroidia bacterium]
SSFTMLVLCCLLIVVLYHFILISKQFIQTKITGQKKEHNFAEFLKQNYKIPFWNKLYLSNKLQLYVVGVVFITFCVILFVTIRYFNNSNQTRQIKHLWDKSTEIANTISTRANLQAIFKRNENNILYDLSNYYNTDINLFDPDGKLQFSSNSKIFDQGLIGRLMKPEVYRELKFDKKSGVVNNEKLGSLNYIASYLSIFDNDLNLKGYINLPYFTNEQDLIREISNYSATLINLFILIFALAAILAYLIGQQIIKPLDTIRKELSLVKLGKEYTPLKYKNNDEIGLLISEYNKMLTELEYSSNKLAESERQGAWREMAKQVAHEIKNPLTPMKLSLQHLQLAIQRKDENLDEKVTRTSQLLIDQIESLSKMAEEFSSFAKMPEAKNARVDVGEELNKACDLFSRKEGISIKKSIPEKTLTAHIDSQQMGRVFNNIIKNAIQSIPKDQEGLIEASIKSEGSTIFITFKDNGKGIPPELYSKIFSPNFSTKNSGMGLGLAISKKIIEQFNGSIRFESEKDHGTIFFIELPLNTK